MVLRSVQLLFQRCALILWVALGVGVHLEDNGEGVNDCAFGDSAGGFRALGVCDA
jgi:hypothetical protein